MPTTQMSPERRAAIQKAVAAKVALGKRVAAAELVLSKPYGKTDAEILSAARVVTIDVPANDRGRTIGQLVAQAKNKRDKVARIKADARKAAIKKVMVDKWVQGKKDAVVDERIASAIAAKVLARETH